jgi:hypothetical protein
LQSQGILEEYRRLTKASHGTRPRDLLIEVFRMLCGMLGVIDIFTVSDAYRNQRSRYFSKAPITFFVNYDEVWADRGGVRVHPMFYRLDVNSQQRDIHTIPANKRAMYRRRYALLSLLEQQMHLNYTSRLATVDKKREIDDVEEHDRGHEAVNGLELDLVRITSPWARRPDASQRRAFGVHQDLGQERLVGPHAEERLRRLKRRFQQMSLVAVLLAVGVVFFTSPWRMTATLKHFLSFPDCAVARLLSIAPAPRGQPGYWSRHDRDGDGIACEPFDDADPLTEKGVSFSAGGHPGTSRSLQPI